MLNIISYAIISKTLAKLDHFYRDHTKPGEVWKISFYKSVSVRQMLCSYERYVVDDM